MKYLIIAISLTLTACDSIPGWAVNKCVEKCGVDKVDQIDETFYHSTWLCTCTNGWQLKVTTEMKQYEMANMVVSFDFL